jgi:hypothetical protein
MEMKIKVITYEQDRLEHFTNLKEKAQKTYNRLYKKFKDAPYLSAEATTLSDAGREVQFLADVVEMLEKGHSKQSENVIELPCKVGDFIEWKTEKGTKLYRVNGFYYDPNDRGLRYLIDICIPVIDNENIVRIITKEEHEKALAKMKGGAE